MGAAPTENATERVVVLMTPRQKAEAVRRAKAAHLSVGDFIRRQTFGDEDVLAAMLEQLRESTASANAALETALAAIEKSRLASGYAPALARTRAQAEFADVSPEAFAELVASQVDHSAPQGGAR